MPDIVQSTCIDICFMAIASFLKHKLDNFSFLSAVEGYEARNLECTKTFYRSL